MASAACLAVFVSPFQNEDGGSAIPKEMVSTYKGLVSATCLAFDRDSNKCSLEFFLHPQNIASGIKPAIWDAGAFFSIAQEGALQIYVRFTERPADAGYSAAPTAQPTSSKRDSSSQTNSSCKPVKSLKRASFLNPSATPLEEPVHSHPLTPAKPRDRTSSSSLSEPDTRNSTQDSEGVIRSSSDEDTDIDDIEDGATGRIPQAVHTVDASNVVVCNHPKPPKPNNSTRLELPFIPETKNMFQKWKDFAGTAGREGIDMDDSYDDVRDKIAQRMYSAVGSGQVVVLRKYKQQIHYEVCLGTKNSGVFRMQRPLRVMDYCRKGEELIGHIHVWLEKDGEYFDDLESTLPDEEYAAGAKNEKPRSRDAGRFFNRCKTIPLMPDSSCTSNFCADPISLRVRFRSNRDTNTKCAELESIFVGKAMLGEYSGMIGSEQVRKTVTENVIERMKNNGFHPKGIWIDFGVYFQDDTKRANIMTFEDPRQTLHQFLSKQRGAPRELHGSVVFKQRRKASCCDGFEGPVLLGCDGKKCKTKWSHPRCLGLDDVPKSLYWFCEDCSKAESAKSD